MMPGAIKIAPCVLAILMIAGCISSPEINDKSRSSKEQLSNQERVLKSFGYRTINNPEASRVLETGVPLPLHLPETIAESPIDATDALGYLNTAGLNVMASPDINLRRRVSAPRFTEVKVYLDVVCRQLGCKATIDWSELTAVIQPFSQVEEPVIEAAVDGETDIDKINAERMTGSVTEMTVAEMLRRVLPSGYQIRSDLTDKKKSETFGLSYDAPRATVIHQIEVATGTRVLLYPRLKLAVLATAGE